MEIRLIREEDDRRDISRVYEKSWKYAYKSMIPQDYLDSIPKGNWAQFVDSPGIDSLVLIKDEEIIGTSSYCSSRFVDMKGWGEIISIYLLPEHMGKGYGGKLLKAAVAELSQKGFSRVFLWVLEENRRARQFYETMGFQWDGTILKDRIGGKEVNEVRYIRFPDEAPAFV